VIEPIAVCMSGLAARNAPDGPGVGWGVRLGVCLTRPRPSTLSVRRGPGLLHIVSVDKCHSALPPCGKVHVEISQGISDLACHRGGDLRHYGRAALHVRIVPSVRGGVTRQEHRRGGRRCVLPSPRPPHRPSAPKGPGRFSRIEGTYLAVDTHGKKKGIIFESQKKSPAERRCSKIVWNQIWFAAASQNDAATEARTPAAGRTEEYQLRINTGEWPKRR
jgi:hypothetical protein